MPRKLQSAVVCTVSLAITACASAESGPTQAGSTVPPLGLASAKPTPRMSASAKAAAADKKQRKSTHAPKDWEGKQHKIDYGHAITQNAVDQDGRFILAQGESCVIKVPPTGPSEGQDDEYEYVDCPPDYDDVAWDDCRYIVTRDKEGCYCLPDGGNPPPLPNKIKCPDLERNAR